VFARVFATDGAGGCLCPERGSHPDGSLMTASGVTRGGVGPRWSRI